jgi:hypothetical protein
VSQHHPNSTELSAMLEDLGLSPDLRAAIELLLEATLASEQKTKECECCICREEDNA